MLIQILGCMYFWLLLETLREYPMRSKNTNENRVSGVSSGPGALMGYLLIENIILAGP